MFLALFFFAIQSDLLFKRNGKFCSFISLPPFPLFILNWTGKEEEEKQNYIAMQNITDKTNCLLAGWLADWRTDLNDDGLTDWLICVQFIPFFCHHPIPCDFHEYLCIFKFWLKNHLLSSGSMTGWLVGWFKELLAMPLQFAYLFVCFSIDFLFSIF